MPQKPKVYKWANAHEWLDDYLSAIAEDGNVTRLLSEARTLAAKLDGDQIQDEYESEMDEAGYFDESSVP